jgi:hypothetical protein
MAWDTVGLMDDPAMIISYLGSKGRASFIELPHKDLVLPTGILLPA